MTDSCSCRSPRGKSRVRQRRLPVLHVPRQRRRAAAKRRQPRLETLHGSRRGDANGEDPGRRRDVRAIRRRHLGAPTLDLKRQRLYVTTGNNYSLPATPMSDAIVALDPETGNIVWSQQALPNDVYNSACSQTPKAAGCPEGNGPDYDFGSPAILVTTTGGANCCSPDRRQESSGRSIPTPRESRVAVARRQGRHQRRRAMGHGQ